MCIKRILSLCCAGFFVLFSLEAIADKPHPLIGTWQTIDDVSGKPKAIIKIEEKDDHTISGKIVKIFSQNKANPSHLCKQCKGDKKNQPLLGLVIMEHLKQSEANKNAWTDGEILDPKNGKTYHCNIQLLENGKRLAVRGFIGLPLFGRSQTWIKYSA